ncbi:MAG: PepSY domain-containing protein [Alphaproteobacteria bacterium]|nr:PepSY domain-containing protein [Alphaproteobacteria bacterium]
MLKSGANRSPAMTAIRPLLASIHRWTALVFALPLLAVIATGLVLSFEPIVATAARAPGSVTPAAVEAALQRFDPQSQARMIAIVPQDGALTIGGGGAARWIDLRSGEEIAGASALTTIFRTARRMHETLLLDLGWLVTASTVAMLVLVVLGVAMGWTRLRNNLFGWHKATGWFLLPLVFASPLTGLFLALGISLAAAPPPAPRAAPLPMVEAVRLVAAGHDLANLGWIRRLGPNLVARIAVDGELKTFRVGRDGLEALPRAWSRVIHEGVYGGVWGGVINVVTSIALVFLLVSGVVLWVQGRLRIARHRARRRTAAAPV